VDQWDWERVIGRRERSLDFLQEIVRAIYGALRQTEAAVHERYPQIEPVLPSEIAFVHAEELLERWPDLGPRQREDKIAAERGAVFVIGIGGELADGSLHDGRAPDYDDWVTPTGDGRRGLNGDILLWYPLLDRAIEISSMGIRVDRESLVQQLELRDALERREFVWHKRLLAGELPLSVGGGIGQSRLCMYLLRKLHVGEVHSSVWPESMVQECRAAGVNLL
jgi:aspartate--ammonia ligase